MNYKLEFYPSTETIDYCFTRTFDSLAKCNEARDIIADYTLAIQERCLMNDYSNMAIIYSKNDDGDWVEIDD